MNELRDQHDASLAKLSARQSTLHFAHAAVSTFLCCVFGGASLKLSIDTEHAWAPDLIVPAAIIAGTAALYAIVRLVMGRFVLAKEVVEFETLQSLRRQLKLDEPPMLAAPRA